MRGVGGSNGGAAAVVSFAKTASDSLGERACSSDRPKTTGRREG